MGSKRDLNFDDLKFISSLKFIKSYYAIIEYISSVEFSIGCVVSSSTSLGHLKSKNVGAVIVITSNDPFVVSAWGKVLIHEHLHDKKDIPQLIFANDINLSSKNGLTNDTSGFVRNSRYATLIDSKTRKIVYLGVETERKVSVSGYDAVSARL